MSCIRASPQKRHHYILTWPAEEWTSPRLSVYSPVAHVRLDMRPITSLVSTQHARPIAHTTARKLAHHSVFPFPLPVHFSPTAPNHLTVVLDAIQVSIQCPVPVGCSRCNVVKYELLVVAGNWMDYQLYVGDEGKGRLTDVSTLCLVMPTRDMERL